jgi:serine/threonine protein kinase
VPVHRAGEAGGLAYYAMDYCEGESLAERLERGPLKVADAVRLACELLEGLEVVHKAGLVHRDIKPANVFFEADRAVLGDFGLAVPEAVRASTPTEPAGFVGTPGYTPPEQAAGGAVTVRTDLYAVGVVLYEAITGRRWYAPAPEGAPDWSGIPTGFRPALRRALARRRQLPACPGARRGAAGLDPPRGRRRGRRSRGHGLGPVAGADGRVRAPGGRSAVRVARGRPANARRLGGPAGGRWPEQQPGLRGRGTG